MKNKLIVSIDGIRKDRLSCYNFKQKKLTPNLSRISPQCVIFDDMLASATSTGMCFASLFTGKYPAAFGRKTFGDTLNPFPDNVFSDHENLGYETVVCLNKRFETHAHLINAFSKAKFWWTGKEVDKSVSNWKDVSCLRPQEQAQYFIEKSEDIDRPFFAWIHLWGFSAPQERFLDITSFDADARVAELDETIGILFDHFCETSEIFIFADHGYAFFEHNRWGYGKDGHGLTESVVSVPMLVFNGKQKGRNSSLVSQVRFREIAKESTCSLSIKDSRAFCESRYIKQPDIALVVRKNSFKLIYYYDCGKFEFYDLNSDPNENIDYAGEMFYKLSRDKSGGHPNLKPFVLRTDWDDLEEEKKDLKSCAVNYYGPSFKWSKKRLSRFISKSKKRFLS